MKTVRKRAVVKAMKKHAIRLVERYSSVEQARICCGVGIISRKDELAMLDSMTHYCEILYSIFPRYDERYHQFNDWWMEELLNSV